MHETHQNPPVDDKEKIKLFNANCNLRNYRNQISKKKNYEFFKAQTFASLMCKSVTTNTMLHNCNTMCRKWWWGKSLFLVLNLIKQLFPYDFEGSRMSIRGTKANPKSINKNLSTKCLSRTRDKQTLLNIIHIMKMRFFFVEILWGGIYFKLSLFICSIWKSSLLRNQTIKSST